MDYFFFNEVHAVRMLQRAMSKRQNMTKENMTTSKKSSRRSAEENLPTTYQFAHVPRFFEKQYMIQFLEENPINHTVNGVSGRHIADWWVPHQYVHFMLTVPSGKPLHHVAGNKLPYVDGSVPIQVGLKPCSDCYAFWMFPDSASLQYLIDVYDDDRRGYVSNPMLWITLNDNFGVTEAAAASKRSAPTLSPAPTKSGLVTRVQKMPSANDLFDEHSFLPVKCEEARSQLRRAPTGRGRDGNADIAWRMLLQVQVFFCNVIAAGAGQLGE